MKVFLDTNVLVSAVISRGLCRDILSTVLEKHEVVVSRLVLEEFVDVLRHEFEASEQQVNKALMLLEDAEVMPGSGIILAAGELDVNDAAILAAAVEAEADVLVTGDTELLESDAMVPITVVSPRRFWQMTRPTNGTVLYPDPTEPTDPNQVSEPGDDSVKEKSFAFALSIIKLCKELERNREYVLSRQLMRAGTSIGANVEEAGAAESRKDFLHKMSIASKEAREAHYWLRLLSESDINPGVDLDPYLDESLRLIRLLTAIVKTTGMSLTKPRTDRSVRHTGVGGGTKNQEPKTKN